ncbi:uncharacterized protein LOC142357159 [Convolutriloba macropyga]|uniref:uncharacterized protein LOC142357159 n=1 Tax=Convolutriloba macropyga TaxID=536237 RepID=UPI003F5268F0
MTLAPEVQKQVDSMLLKDLRVELRNRGLNPAGGVEALRERLTESILNGGSAAVAERPEPVMVSNERVSNNYTRTGGQNVGNFMTERPTSRVLDQPGGKSQICLGDATPEKPAAPTKMAVQAPAADENTDSNVGNNYSRPDGQNVGNFITDRPSSKVLAPPGGASNVLIGGDSGAHQNNYVRPEGQNIGNFITDRPSSHVLQPPGGASQIMFG